MPAQKKVSSKLSACDFLQKQEKNHPSTIQRESEDIGKRQK